MLPAAASLRDADGRAAWAAGEPRAAPANQVEVGCGPRDDAAAAESEPVPAGAAAIEAAGESVPAPLQSGRGGIGAMTQFNASRAADSTAAVASASKNSSSV